MKAPILGQTSEGKPVSINIDRLIETRMLVQANSGAGKSWALRRLLEQTHGRVQHLVIDVEDEFHTLREKFDYVLAGRHGGDCPADVRSATLLARRLLELGISSIIGIFELKHHERIQFVKLFLESLVNAPRDLWHPVLVVIDEAHMFCPEKDKAESASAVIDLMTRGRKRGFCGVLATQRIAKLNKDAAAEANNKLIGRSALDVDMKRAADELGFTSREQQQQLRTLQPGQFFAFGPAVSNTVIELTVGPVETTHPRAGQRSAPAAPPRETVHKVLAQLADLPQEAAQEAQTAAELRKRVQELERDARRSKTGSTPQIDPDALNKAREQGRAEGRREMDRRLESLRAVMKKFFIQVCGYFDNGKAVCERFRVETLDTESGVTNTTTSPQRPVQPVATRSIPDSTKKIPPHDLSSGAASNGHAQLGKDGLRRILTALAQCPAGLAAGQLGIRAQLSSKSGTFDTYIRKGRANGWIEGAKSRYKITEAGLEALGEYTPLPTGKDLLNYWLSDLGNSGAARMLTALAAQYPETLTAEQLGEAAEISSNSGTFDTYLRKLKALELVTGKKNDLRASEDLI